MTSVSFCVICKNCWINQRLNIHIKNSSSLPISTIVQFYSICFIPNSKSNKDWHILKFSGIETLFKFIHLLWFLENYGRYTL